MKNQVGADLLAWLQSDAGTAALAGAAGGLVRWLTLRESWKDGAMSLLVGSICASYLGPLVEPMLVPVVGQLTGQEDAEGFSSFVVGLGGIGFSGFVIDAMRRFRADSIERKAVPQEADPAAPGPAYDPAGAVNHDQE